MDSSGKKVDFCIEFDFEKHSPNPSRIFVTITELIKAYETFDKSITSHLDPNIKTIAIINDVETGSIKVWLSNLIKALDDEALKGIDWKPLIGQYLVKGKYKLLKFLEGKSGIENESDIVKLENTFMELAEECQITDYPFFMPVKRDILLPSIGQITHATTNLNKKDNVFYNTQFGNVLVNKEFRLGIEEIEELKTKKTVKYQQVEMTLKIKKPDYLGESQWEFKYNQQKINAKIMDFKWLDEFHKRKHDVRPGDSLKAMVELIEHYNYDNFVFASHYNIVKVINIIPGNDGDGQIDLQITWNKY